MTAYDPWAKIREEVATPAPVTKLRELGLTRGTPAWWRSPGNYPGEGGTYALHPSFLSDADIRQLAALSLEGYTVKVNPRRDCIKVVIAAP